MFNKNRYYIIFSLAFFGLGLYAQETATLEQKQINEVLAVIKSVAPDLYTLFLKHDPTGKEYITISNAKTANTSLTVHLPDGLPVLTVNPHYLLTLPLAEQRFIIANELAHYVLNHNLEIDFHSLNYPGHEELLKKAYTRVQEDEADRGAILDFGIPIKDGIAWMDRRIIENKELALKQPSKKTFKQKYPLFLHRKKHLESLHRELEAKRTPPKQIDWEDLAQQRAKQADILFEQQDQAERKRILTIIKSIAPDLYAIIIKRDPTGQQYITIDYDISSAQVLIHPSDGLPLFGINPSYLSQFTLPEQRFIIAHELTHYMLSHLIEKGFHELKHKDEPLLMNAYSRVQEDEADRGAILDFGIPIKDGIAWADKCIKITKELLLKHPHKQTFKQEHPLCVNRKKHLVSLQRELEVKRTHPKKINWLDLAQKHIEEYEQANRSELLDIIKSIDPHLYTFLIKHDPTGQEYIRINDESRNASVRTNRENGLPVFIISPTFLDLFTTSAKRFIIAHELSHYILGHRFERALYPFTHTGIHAKQTFLENAYSRVHEDEADRSAIMNFGIPLDEGIAALERSFEITGENALHNPHKQTFKQDHPLYVHRKQHLKSLRRELEARKALPKQIDWQALAQHQLKEIQEINNIQEQKTRKALLVILKSIDPILYTLLTQHDPTGQRHIEFDNDTTLEVIVNRQDGLPLLRVDPGFLFLFPLPEQRFIVAHELTHYVLNHNREMGLHPSTYPHNNPFFKEAYPAFEKAYSRVQEDEADRGAIVDFGIPLADGIAWMTRCIELYDESDLPIPSKQTFKQEHPLFLHRKKHLESLRRELEAKRTPRKRIDWPSLAKQHLQQLEEYYDSSEDELSQEECNEE